MTASAARHVAVGAALALASIVPGEHGACSAATASANKDSGARYAEKRPAIAAILMASVIGIQISQGSSQRAAEAE